MDYLDSKIDSKFQEDYFVQKLTVLFIIFCIFFLYFFNINLAVGKILAKVFFNIASLFLLFRVIGSKGFSNFKWFLAFITLEVFVTSFFADRDKLSFTSFGAYFVIIPNILYFIQMYNFESEKNHKSRANYLINLLILACVFAVCYFFIIETVLTFSVAAIILNLTILAISLGLAIMLKMDRKPKVTYILSTGVLVITVLFAALYFFTANTHFIIIPVGIFQSLSSFFLFLGIYYQFKSESKA